MKIKELSRVIKEEETWCREARGTSKLGKDFEKGFIAGLKHIRTVLKTIETMSER